MRESILSRPSSGLRPLIHFTAPKGWINDPNGLIYYKGQYHLFYQHNPYSTEWASMHWGHAVSNDMLHWEDLPIALYPDSAYDKDEDGGCFSGSAIEKDGMLFLVYTGSVHKNGILYQTQNIAYSKDGVSFTKYEGNPVITKPESAADDFRDPKIFLHNGKYYLVIGGAIDGDGKIFIYSSDDIYNWEYNGILYSSDKKTATMIECPDFFPLDDKWVLVFSPMGNPERKKGLYIIGDMDFDTYTFSPEYTGEIDRGFDYYAPQSFLDENGNRTMIAWMNRWLWMPYGEDHGPTTGEGWRCALSLPRSVRLMNGQLEFSPITGLCNIFKRRNKLTAEIDRSNPLMLTREAAMRISVEFTEEEIPSAVLNITITSKSSLLVDLLSRKAILITGGKSKGVIVAELANTQKHRLEIILDKTAYEIFIDDGYDVISVEIYEDYNDIELSVPYKKAVVNVTTEY